MAQRINATLAAPFELVEGRVRISVGIGVVIYPIDGSDELQLRKAADQALYAAKAAGRNIYRLAAGLLKVSAIDMALPTLPHTGCAGN